jgi:peroxiredoxin
MEPQDWLSLPADLPVPADDGAARHLPGQPMPDITLPASDGGEVRLSRPGAGTTVIYLYPRTGEPGVPMPEGWDQIPGARGCTPESCGFRDHHRELLAAGAARVYGMSSQSTDYQREAVERLRLPFPLLSDAELAVAAALGLPTFTVEGVTLYTRLTLIVTGGVIEHVFYPVFPPDRHAREVLDWFGSHPREGS